jgi:hypothetical protein
MRLQASAEGDTKPPVTETKGDKDVRRLRSAIAGKGKGKTKKSVKYSDSSSMPAVGGGKGADEALDLFVDDISDTSETSDWHSSARVKDRKGHAHARLVIDDDDTTSPSLKRPPKDDGRSKPKRFKSKAIVNSSDEDPDKSSEATLVTVEKTRKWIYIVHNITELILLIYRCAP